MAIDSFSLVEKSMLPNKDSHLFAAAAGFVMLIFEGLGGDDKCSLPGGLLSRGIWSRHKFTRHVLPILVTKMLNGAKLANTRAKDFFRTQKLMK